jgi:hypothetical protein
MIKRPVSCKTRGQGLYGKGKMEAGGSRWSRCWRTRQDRKHSRLETSHKLCREAGRRAECWKSACSVRRGGGWKRVYGSASEALEQPTRLQIWKGESPFSVNYLYRTDSISGACGGNKARYART